MNDYAQRLHRNIELWARSHPKEAVLLPYLEEGDIDICQMDNGETNLCLKKGGKNEYFHSPQGALAEAHEWFGALALRGIQVLYVYGIGFGYYYEAAKTWLKRNPKRGIVFLEDDPHVLRHFLASECATDLLQNPQAHLVYLKDSASKKEIFDELYWHFPSAKVKFSALQYYQKNKNALFDELSHELAYSFDVKKALLEEYLNFGAAYFVNLYQNLLHLPDSYLGNHFFGKFNKVPAIICGAGPSLEKNMAALQQLKQRALIFAGGSAINILNGAAIQPHFCVAIDPNAAQQVRLRNIQSLEVPFFYRNRLNYSAFTTIHGPHLYITGSGGYDIAEYFEEKFGIISDSFDEGHNVVTFAMEIACKMGCDPIIFAGMDLAFTDRKTYSAGVVFDASVEGKTMRQYSTFEKSGFIRPDIFGNPIYTLWKWVAESEWIGEWAAEHSNVTLINCTEGGLGFPGIPNKPLTETIQKYCQQESDLRSRIFIEMQNSYMPKATPEAVNEAMNDLKLSLERCVAHFDVLLEESNKIKEKIASAHETSPQLQSGRAALAEIDLAEEAGYRYLLDMFNLVSTNLLSSELQALKYSSKPKQEWQKNIMRVDINQKRLRFLQDVAKANIELINFALENFNPNVQPEVYLPEKLPISKPLKAADLFPGKKLQANSQVELQKTYYPDGSLQCEKYVKDGLLHGSSQYFSEKGELLIKANFSQGKEEGELLWYYPSKALYSRQNFVQGEAHGLQEYYYPDGTTKTLLQYDRDCLVGKVQLFAPDGILKREIQIG